jgi:hypothetical protein
MAAPASLGRYGLMAGTAEPSTGRTNRNPNTAASAPAVLRTSHPNAGPGTAVTARNSADPITGRRTPGAASEIDASAPASTGHRRLARCVAQHRGNAVVRTPDQRPSPTRQY